MTIGVLYNPWTGQATRDWIMDRVAGGNGDGYEDFGDTITSESTEIPGNGSEPE